MELIMLDENFIPCGIIDNFSSLSWTRRYYDVGSFNLQITISDYMKIKNAKYIYSNSFIETAKIEACLAYRSVRPLQGWCYRLPDVLPCCGSE